MTGGVPCAQVMAPAEITKSNAYVNLGKIFSYDLYLKIEGFNFAGSIKLRTAVGLVAAAQEAGRIRPDSVLIESSSGNLGLALGIIAASKGIPFVCVTDPRCNRSTINLLRSLGTEVVIVSEPDDSGGYLKSRIDFVRTRCAVDARYVWLNQYENPANWKVHYHTTAVEIADQFSDLDALFIGTGTAGTLMGCARYFRDSGRRLRVIAVDAVGSAAFGGSTGPRLIPGLGTTQSPPLVDTSLLDDVILVEEADTVRYCRALASRGLLVGGSTGTVVSGAVSWLKRNDPDRKLRAVAISPDLADRYADTIYDDDWVERAYGPCVLATPVVESLRPSPLQS